MICALIIAAHMGGSISDHEALVRWVERSGCDVRIEGQCASACTMLLAVGCVTPGARLGFHRPEASSHLAEWTRRMARLLPPRLARWYLDGPAASRAVVWITGAEAIRLGARRC